MSTDFVTMMSNAMKLAFETPEFQAVLKNVVRQVLSENGSAEETSTGGDVFEFFPEDTLLPIIKAVGMANGIVYELQTQIAYRSLENWKKSKAIPGIFKKKNSILSVDQKPSVDQKITTEIQTNKPQIKTGDVLRYYTNKNDIHFTAIVLKTGEIRGTVHGDLYNSFQDWIESMPEFGKLYINHRRPL